MGKKIIHYINSSREDFGMTMECGKVRKDVRFVAWDKAQVNCPDCLNKMKEKTDDQQA